MAEQPGTLERIALELTRALQPLEDRLASGQLVAFVGELGLRIPAPVATHAQVVGHAGSAVAAIVDLAPLVPALIQAIDDEDSAEITRIGIELIQKLGETLREVKALADGLDAASAAGGLTPAESAEVQAFAQVLARRVLDFLLIEYIRQKCSCLISALNLFGIVDDMDVPADPANPLGLPYRKREIHLERTLDLFTDPEAFVAATYDFGNDTFDGTKLFPRVQRLLDDFDIPTMLIEMPGQLPVLEAFVLRFVADDSVLPPGLLARLRIPGTRDFTQTYRLSEIWSLKLDARVRCEAGMEVGLYPPLNLEFFPPTGSATVEVLLGLVAERANGVMTLLGQTGGSGLFLQRFGLGVGVTGTWSTNGGGPSFEPTADMDVTGGRLIIDFSNSDGFIKTVASGVNINAELGFKAHWSPSSGLRFEGSAAIELAIPSHISLGPLEIVTLYLRSGLAPDGSIPTELSGAFNVMLGPLAASVERIGLRVITTFPDQGGNLGPANLAFEFKPPNGVGLAIDAGAVKGGGYLYFDFEKEEYAGVLELDISGIVRVTAIGLVTTRMPDGSKGFSLLIIITAEFGSGIQIGMGFTLIGVGGLLGLNRTVRLTPLAEGVRTGAVNNIMFPRDVVANAPRIISDLRAIFPVFEGKFLIGPMAKLGWGSPPLITLSLGVIIEIPGNIAILGVLRCILPTEDAPILVLQVAFVGAIEFDKKRLWFFAGIFDSKVLTFTLEGEMGILFGWGDDATFVLSVGGFHPRFSPPPLPFPSPKRLSIAILDEAQARIRVSCYFAVTTNTVQFGARAELFFGFSGLSVEGNFHFDALFQFSPFYFIIELGASVSLKIGGTGIFSISLELALEGPTPWHAKGRGSISFFFFDVSANFDETWGREQDTTLPPIDVFPILADELAKEPNWTALPPPRSTQLVALRVAGETQEFVLHPVGRLRVTQRAMPLNSRLDLFGTQKPADVDRFALAVTTPGLVVAGAAREDFAPAQFHAMSRNEKLAAPAFAKEDGGVDITADGDLLRSSLVVRRVVRYEETIIDTNFKRFAQQLVDYTASLFHHFLSGNAAARSALSARLRNQMQPFTDVITAGTEGFGVATTDTNALMGGTAVFGSYHAAKQHMEDAVARNPALAGSLHVVPSFEINEAA